MRVTGGDKTVTARRKKSAFKLAVNQAWAQYLERMEPFKRALDAARAEVRRVERTVLAEADLAYRDADRVHRAEYEKRIMELASKEPGA